jgi:hypothetical protein
VDTAKLGLRIARRPQLVNVEGLQTSGSPPPRGFDVTARKVPDGFKVTGLPEPDPDPEKPEPEKMDTVTTQESPRQSRKDAHIAAKAATPKK